MKKLLIIACMLLPFIGSSQIAYTNANNLLALSNNDILVNYSATHDLDIDNDGQRDFVFKIQKSTLTSQFQSLSIGRDGTHDNFVKMVVTGNPQGPSPITDNIIDVEGTFVCPDYYIPSPYLNEPIGTQGWFSGSTLKWGTLDFYNGDISIYIGVEFERLHPINNDTNTHYGYIHVGLGANNALVIHSYAWNPVPGDCIMADDYYLPNSGIICTQNVTVYDTTNVMVYDTTIVPINDTTFFNIPVWDTLLVFDSVPIWDTLPAWDTTNVNVFDTTNIMTWDTTNVTTWDTLYFQSNDTVPFFDSIPVTVFDTTSITTLDTIIFIDTLTYTVIDTNWINLGTYLDTLTITVFDTTIFIDTVTVTIYDTLHLYVLDTIFQTVWDTVGCDSIGGGPDPWDPLDPYEDTQTHRQGGFGLYPNPAQTVVNIRGFHDDVSDYFLIDVLGNKTEIFDEQLFVDHLPAGIYMIEKVYSDGRREVEKFQKH